MIPPERRHFAENAAQMLESGKTPDDIAGSMRLLGFDAQQTAELLSLAREIVARNRARASNSVSLPPGTNQLSRKQIYLIVGILVVGALVVGWLLSSRRMDATVEPPPVVSPTSARE